MKTLSLITIFLLALGCSSGTVESSPATSSANQPAAWNRLVLSFAVEEDNLLTLKGVRTAAMTAIAMHDAANAVAPRYASYVYSAKATGADAAIAAAQAAFEVIVDAYPDKRKPLLAERRRWIGDAVDDARSARSIALGKSSAAAIMKKRTDDRWSSESEYVLHPMAPGVYAEFPEHSGTPEGFVFGAGWAIAQPFTMNAPDQFRSPPPPAIDSAAYAIAFNEVKEVGRWNSASRTADQSHLAMWWKDFIENSHNRLARSMVNDEHLDLWQSSRLFALLNMSIFDAYISSFDNKFLYNHWRPYTAIRWAEHDGNPDTVADPEWNNLHRHTYAFPSYPSAHGTACGAAMAVMADTFGDQHPFTMVTPEVDSAGPLSDKIAMHPPNRSFDSFRAAAHECALSRVYLGIHFRYDSIAGEELGTDVGTQAVENYLRPLPKPPPG